MEKQRRELREFIANYDIGDYLFDLKRFFPDPIFIAITGVRVGSPEIILRETAARKKRKKLIRDGKLGTNLSSA